MGCRVCLCMKRLITSLFACIIALQAYTLTHIYSGNSTYHSDIIATWDGKYVYYGSSMYSSDIIATVMNGKVYRGRSTYSSDIEFRYDGMLPAAIIVFLCL